MTPSQMRSFDAFQNKCWAVHERPEQERRSMVSASSSIKFAWAVSVVAVFSFLSLLSGMIT